MAGGGDLGFYIGSYTSDANATAFLTGRGYTQARGYIYWDSVTSQLKVWDGSAWGVVTGAGAVSPWTESPAGMIYPIDYSTDDVAVGTNAMAGTERFRVVGNTIFSGQVGVNEASISSSSYVDALDDDESATRNVFKARLVKDAAGAKTAYGGFVSTANIDAGSVGNIYHVGGVLTTAGGGVTGIAAGCYFAVEVGSGDTVAIERGVWLSDTTGSGTITTAYGIDIEDQGLSSTTTYGIRIKDQSGTTTYGIYQEGADDVNVFMGQVGINQTTFAGTNYVEVLDNEESSTRYGYVSTLEKNAAGAKTGYLGFSSGGSVDAGSVSAIQHFKASTTTAGGSVTSSTGYYSVAVVGSGDTVTTQRGLWLGDATGSGTITTAYGILIEDQGLGSTTTYGIYIADQSGTTAYGVYQSGLSDFNFLNGTTGVGENPTSLGDPEFAKLYVTRTETADLQADTKVGLHVGIYYDPSSTGYDIYDYRAIDIDILNLSTDTSCDIERAYGVYVNSPAGQGGDIEFAVAFYCEDMGLDSDVLEGWGVYLNGSTTRNYMAGVLGAKNNTPSNSYAIDAGDNINIATGKGLCVGGIQVVTDQQAAIGDIADTSGTDQDQACRTRINAILDVLRTHGLIDT